MEKSESPTGRIIVVGSGHIPRSVMTELVAMGHHAVQVIALEMDTAQVEARISATMAALGEAFVSPADWRKQGFGALYGRVPLTDEVPALKPIKNDPWYRREAKGGKRNRRW